MSGQREERREGAVLAQSDFGGAYTYTDRFGAKVKIDTAMAGDPTTAGYVYLDMGCQDIEIPKALLQHFISAMLEVSAREVPCPTCKGHGKVKP